MTDTPTQPLGLRRRAVATTKSALGAALSGSGLARRAHRDRFVILAFHRVDDRFVGDGLTLGRDEFDAYCRLLARDFRVVPLAAQLASLRAGDRALAGTFSITFDDGYADNHAHAAPILEKHGLPATFFVAAGYVGTRRVPFWDERYRPEPPEWMTWEQVRDLARRGFEIGCHTVNHVDLGKVSPDEARRELAESRATIERELGRPAPLFAYPFGGEHQMSAANLEVVKSLGFACSMSCCGGVNAIPADPYRLRRAPVSGWQSSPAEWAFDLARGRV